MEIRTVGVVGAGNMGAGIALVCAQAGYPVKLSDISQACLERGIKTIQKTLSRLTEQGNIDKLEVGRILTRITTTDQLKDYGQCDLIIEAVIENLEIKRKLFKELDGFCPSSALLASNTSCLSILDIAMSTQRPEKVIGLHFFNPVPRMPLLEVIPSICTCEETLSTCMRFGNSIKKTTIVVKDSPGFIVNRLLMPFILNAIRMLESNATSPDNIDTAVKLGLNHPVGPLALADLIGLDVVYQIVNSIYDELKDPQYIAPISLKKMVVAGRLGRKSGKGFYDYPE